MPNKLTREGWINKFHEIYGNKYDYSKFCPNGCYDKSIIICQEHGEFVKTPREHLRSECPICSDIEKSKKMSLNWEDVKKEAEEIHSHKYTYEHFVYTAKHSKSFITCPIHGDFEQSMHSHIDHKQGCPKCAIERRKLTQQEFEERMFEIYGRKYDLSKFKYINYNTPGIVGCPIHGDFERTPAQLFEGDDCIYCKGYKVITKEDFIREGEKLFGDHYDYSKANYINYNNKVTIICKICGNEFEILPGNHLKGNGGCRECAKKLFSEMYSMHMMKCCVELEKFTVINMNITNLPILVLLIEWKYIVMFVTKPFGKVLCTI